MNLRTFTAASLLFLLSGISVARQKPNIEGAWEMISAKYEGIEGFTSGRQIKIFTRDRFVFIYQDKDKEISLLSKKTGPDSLAAYSTQFFAGSGTYKLVGNTYTESAEFCTNPVYIGLSVDFTIKVEGDRFMQSGKVPEFQDGKKIRDVLLEETYKRIR